MELASSLSTEEIKQSLREIAKKSGKNIPLTKYLCIPSSKQLQNRIPVWNASSPLLTLLKHALHLYGDVPTTYETGQSKDTTNGHSISYEGVKNSPQDYPKKHPRVLKDVKLKLSADPNHKLFWSHLIFGANQISRALESSQRSNEVELASRTHLLECVLLDAEWITSQMGHHIAHLCADLGIRLVSVTPAGELASCLSTPLHPMKKAIAVGICSSVNTPPELVDWIAKLKMELEPLALPTALDAALHPPSTASSNSPVSVQSVPTKSQTRPANQNEEPWSSYLVDPKYLYIYSSPSHDRVLTLPVLLQRLSSISFGGTRLERTRTNDVYSVPLFKPAFLKTVPPRTDEERRVRKNKKRAKRRRPSLQTESVN